MSLKGFNNCGGSPSKILYVGVDIGKFRHCARALVRRKEWTKAFFFGQGRRGFERFLKQISGWCRRFDCDAIRIGMEPTGNYWKPLFVYLSGRGFDVKLVPPLFVKCEKNKHDNSGLKCDEKDALLIATLVHEGSFVNLTVLTRDMKEVKSLVKQLAYVDKAIVAFSNKLGGWAAEHFPELEHIFKKLNNPKVWELLEKYPFPRLVSTANFEDLAEILGVDRAQLLLRKAAETVGVGEELDAERMHLIFLLKYLRLLEGDRASLKAAIKKALRVESLRNVVRILTSIPGIGDMNAAAIIAALGDLANYRSYRQVLKKAGLNLYHISSGKFRGKKRISKRGFSFLRKMLYMAAECHTRAGSYYFEKYQSLVGRGLKHKEAMVAIMRKLLKVAFALARDGRVFEHDYRCDGATDKDGTSLLRALAA